MQVSSTESGQRTTPPVLVPAAAIPRSISNLEKNILTPLAVAIINNDPETFYKIERSAYQEANLFLRPIRTRRNICLFTLALQSGRPNFSQLIFNQLEKAHLLSQLVLLRDKAGWSPVHHAAMRDVMLYKRLKRVPEATALMTPLSTSPSMLRKILRLSNNCISDANYYIYVRLPNESEDSLLASSDVIQIPGLFHNPPRHFSPLSHLSIPILRQLWFRSSKQCNPASKTFQAYNEYLVQLQGGVESKLALRPVETDDVGNKLPPEVGLGIFARTDIKAGTVLGNYGGWFSRRDDLKTSSMYCMDQQKDYMSNGFRFRSMMAMVNHGMPNAYYDECIVNGINETPIVAMTDINAGEQICCDYQNEYVKSQDLILEFRPRALIQFVRDHPLAQFISLLPKKTNNTLSEYEETVFSRWTYIVNSTPTRFLQLVLTGIISQDQIVCASTNEAEFYDWADESLAENLIVCSRFLNASPILGPQLARQLTKSHYTAQELQKVIDTLNKCLKRVKSLVL